VAVGDISVQFRISSNLQVARPRERGHAGKNDNQAELPTVHNAKNAACGNVQDSDEDKADVDAHELEDGLRIRVNTAG
jgi:hypothetical protein